MPQLTFNREAVAASSEDVAALRGYVGKCKARTLQPRSGCVNDVSFDTMNRIKWKSIIAFPGIHVRV
jgi:hypothetical protein